MNKLIENFEARSPGEIVEVQDHSFNQVLMQAINRDMKPEIIEKMMELNERHERRQAEKAYYEAMTEFKSDPPKIEKDRKVSYGQGKTEYSHATLANITEKISTGLGKCGLSTAWKTEQPENKVTVTCTITHRMGHSESTSLSAAPDTSGSKNSIQAIGSTISYLQRYTLLALTGLATYDMDDDGQGSEDEYISTDQAIEIEDLLKETGADRKKFFTIARADSVETIQAKYYDNLISMLRRKKRQ